MGKLRKRHNWKGRLVVDTLIDKSEQNKIKSDLKEDYLGYDESNPLVLPSSKRKTKKLRDKKAAPVKLLSKKKRKQLEKIISLKEKKNNRLQLLEDLHELKAKPKDLECLIPLQVAQTKGRKKFIAEGLNYRHNKSDNVDAVDINITKGIKRKRPLQQSATANSIVLGEPSSEESDNDSDEEQDERNDVALNLECNHPNESPTKGDSKPNTDTDIEMIPTMSQNLDNAVTTPDKEKKIENITKTAYEILDRLPSIQEDRLKLPILSEEQVVMETILEHPVCVIVGPTGSGKTTQVPQFLYEAGFARNGMKIGVTEPRRVAAISVSKRVAYEMNLPTKVVSYQIRFEGNATPETKIKFMTDGILLKEMQMDPSLKKYSAIIIDEAHERSVYSDILIGILSRVIPKRQAKGNPLKLIIMSATLRVDDFVDNERLFKAIKPPVVKIDSRMFDVSIHFNKTTCDDYVSECYRKVCKIHRQLPEGGILVFLTGQQEVNSLCRMLARTFPDKDYEDGEVIETNYTRNIMMKRMGRKDNKAEKKTVATVTLPEVELFNFIDPHRVSDAAVELSNGDASSGLPVDLDDADLQLDEDPEDFDECVGLNSAYGEEQPLWILPLYSMLPSQQQKLIFDPPPAGKRLCIVATNVAETSLTIPNIKYVVDSGKVKEKMYDPATGVSMFRIRWISQASAKQRAGRAGRTAPGHCYRLYSSAVYNDEFSPHAMADIQKRPIDDLVLVMKSMNLPVVNFPFPTPPNSDQVKQSIKRLIALEALQRSHKKSSKINRKFEIADLTEITEMGRAMSVFPLSPRYAKMIVLCHQCPSLLPYVVVLVCALTVQEVILQTPQNTNENNKSGVKNRSQIIHRGWLGTGQSRLLGDLMILLRAVGAAEYNRQSDVKQWCNRAGLRYESLTEVRKLRRQLTNEINLVSPSTNLAIDPKMKPPTDHQTLSLRQIVLAGSVDRIARRIDESEINDPLERKKWKHAYRTLDMEEPVFLQSTSLLRVDAPTWVTYQDIHETNKIYMRGVTVIEPEWLPIFAPNSCSFEQKIADAPPPRYDDLTDRVVCHKSATFGPLRWQLPDTEHSYPDGGTEIGHYAYMAYFFLSGDICPLLKEFKSHLYEIKTLVSRFAFRFKNQRDSIVGALKSERANSRCRIEEVWKKNSKYLLKEYLNWLRDEEYNNQISALWPPISKDSQSDWR